MGLVQCFVIVLMLSTQFVLTFPPTKSTIYYTERNGEQCVMCPAGEYQKSCKVCVPCAAGSYTTQLNREERCHPCYRDCNPGLHLRVAEPCNSTSDMKCVCEAGYRCTDMFSLSGNCKYCEKIQETTTTEAAAIVSVKDKHTPSASSGHSSTSAKPCTFPKCGLRSVQITTNNTKPETDKQTNTHLAAILCPVVVVGCVALMILFFVRRPRDESCFKQVLLVCNEGGSDASHKSKESTHQFPRDSFSAKQQPSSLSAANLGPVHVHNPGTVIFSLLSQFTGQVGPTIKCGKTAEKECGEEEDERDCPVFHPTSSPSIPLSEEERSGEIDSIFFPSQEQGKDCHMSKEEVL